MQMPQMMDSYLAENPNLAGRQTYCVHDEPFLESATEMYLGTEGNE